MNFRLFWSPPPPEPVADEQWFQDSVTGNKEEAVKRIRKCAEELNLEHLALSKHPLGMGKLTNLTKLSLRNNNLTFLPTEIGLLTALTEFYVNMNKLTALPTEIGRLTLLPELNLSYNKLSSLPTELKHLTRLHNLGLSLNAFTSLPSGIGLLTTLITLDLAKNKLTSLSKEIGQLARLQELNLYENKLTFLPTEIGRLTSLYKLKLMKNELTFLPTEIGQLVNLVKFYPNCNKLTSLPHEIGGLTNLEALNLWQNDLHSLPHESANLLKVFSIHLSNNPNLAELPLSLGENHSLTTIDIESTRIDPAIVQSILRQCRLRRDAQVDEILPVRLAKWGSQIDVRRLSDDQKKTLNEWLLRLEKTRDFALSQTSLARTVCSILADLNGEFQELFFSQAEANNACCEDRAAMALNEIYTSWMILCKSVDLKMLTGVAKTLCLRKELQKLIKNEERESVEIFLYYESTLRERLQLVTAIQNMSHGEIGRRKWIDEETLVETVNENFFDHLLDMPVFEKLAQAALKMEWEAIAQLDLPERPEGDDLSEAVLSWSHDIGKLMQEKKRAWAQCVKRWYDDVLLF